MTLNLYRRHGSRCCAGRPQHATSHESEELRRGWKRCFCPIYASGTIAGQFKRKNTERTDWEAAKTTVGAWEDAGAWDPSVTVHNPVPQVPAIPAQEAQLVTITEATEFFLSNRTQRGIESSTLSKYATFVNSYVPTAARGAM